jgi:hypothetical protein
MEAGFFTVWIAIFSVIIGTLSQPAIQSSTPSAQNPVPSTAATVVAPATSAETPITAREVTLAKCLTENSAKFYGAYWCPHCQEQKKILGSALSQIKYIECDPKGEDANPDACQKANIQGYPTWQMPGKTDLQGAQSFQALSQWSGCAY